MDIKLKQRVAGAIVLTALAIIILPMLLDGSAEERARVIASIPEPPSVELDALTVAEVERGIERLEREGSRAMPEVVTPAAPPADSPEPAPASATADTALDENQLPVSWSLQLASFQNPENAIRLRESLRDAEFQTYIIQAETETGEMFRVFVGPMVHRGRLDEIGTEIEARFDLKGRIVRYEIEDDVRQLGG